MNRIRKLDVASAVPMAIASRNAPVSAPTFTVSTSRSCFRKIPCRCAKPTTTLHREDGVQTNVILESLPAVAAGATGRSSRAADGSADAAVGIPREVKEARPPARSSVRRLNCALGAEGGSEAPSVVTSTSPDFLDARGIAKLLCG